MAVPMPWAAPPNVWPSTIMGFTQGPAVLHDHVIEDLDVSQPRVHRDRGGMGRIGECAGIDVRPIGNACFQTAGVDVRRQAVRAAIPDRGDLLD